MEETPLQETGAVAVIQNPSPSNITVTVTRPDEMEQAQSALILWAENKLIEQDAEVKEADDAYQSALKHRWSYTPLKRIAEKAKKRRDFYEKILLALKAGYTIVPNFPVTAFAIRTDRHHPLKMWTHLHYQKHTQKSEMLPAGEGEYKNPFPLVMEKIVKAVTATTNEVKNYWAEDWKDLHFPITMAKPDIIEATSRSMALKIFDDLAILPGYEPGEGTKAPKMDPMILGRIFDGSVQVGYGERKHVTFMVAWHLNTRDI